MAVQAMVVQSDCTVRGEPVRKGTLVALDLSDDSLVSDYGGTGNLAPLPSGESGDDAGHGAVSD